MLFIIIYVNYHSCSALSFAHFCQPLLVNCYPPDFFFLRKQDTIIIRASSALASFFCWFFFLVASFFYFPVLMLILLFLYILCHSRSHIHQWISLCPVLLHILERRRAAYLNMFYILKKLFMLDIFRRNISDKWRQLFD